MMSKIENLISEKFSYKLLTKLSNIIDDKLKSMNDKFNQLSLNFDKISKKYD